LSLSHFEYCYLHSFPTRRSSDLVILLIVFIIKLLILTVIEFAIAVVNIDRKPFISAALVNDSLTCFSVKLIGISKVILLLKNFADRKSTRLNSSHVSISYAVFCL